ncbi:MAG: hypothetical protein QOC56_1079, partial [Alphaproteobacteria bacterium]|nr:hypothetical protein [Alphaproteobacteria bacterium]
SPAGGGGTGGGVLPCARDTGEIEPGKAGADE